MTKIIKHKKLTAKQLSADLLRYLVAHPGKKFAPRQLGQLLKIDNNKDSIEHALRQLMESGRVEESKNGGQFSLAPNIQHAPEKRTAEVPAKSSVKPIGKSPKFIEGRVDMTRSGAAYIVSDLIESDVYVSPRHLNGALNGDIVSVLLFPQAPRRRGQRIERKPEGEVVHVVKRSNEFFLGTLRFSRRYALFLPDNPNMPIDIYVPLEAAAPARDGDKVVVRVTDWQEGKGRIPIGKVTQVLGKVGGNDFEMQKILINAGFELTHSEEALAEAAAIPETISPQEIALRRDFRDILTFTIDPEDAKDFDDALSIRYLEDGAVEVGVHIADVTHYLKPDSPLDREAYQRSTSVYLVDRSLPMLPEKLSSNLCSLVPHQDRLTFSAVFTFNPKGRITNRWLGKTVIHSHHRFTYEDAQVFLEKPLNPIEEKPVKGRKKAASAELELENQLHKALLDLDRIAKTMRREREKNGAIGFETEEIRFVLAPDGSPIDAYVKERKDAHLLIEDFMLLANREVALFVDQLGEQRQPVPFVYRVHDLPDMERVAEFARFANEMGHPLKIDTPKQIAQSFNRLMKAVQEDERLKILEPLAIRTMAKAVYTTDNIGHYGLGFTHYAHFTSPIRRYSDVLAHRILYLNLEGRQYRMDVSKLEEKCKHISNQERKAAEAERESVKFKQAEWVSKQIGHTFEGTISGFIERGFFVSLPGSRAEGLVEFRYMPHDYDLEEGRLRAKSRRAKHVLKMGDKVRVRVIAVDIERRQIELEYQEDNNA